MATTRTAEAHWEGNLTDGSGRVALASSGVGTFPVTWPSRAEQPDGRTSPEEFIAAAHASCYCMSLSGALGRNGTPPTALDVSAEVGFQPGVGITGSHLRLRADVPGLDPGQVSDFAEDAKANCPVSKALAGVPVTLELIWS